ncbi:MAG: futalosine hydrolase, partial [Jatrophihabitans endophyticus]|nr:futalosine hydrolase [Jatrophihabitans endophyticus]
MRLLVVTAVDAERDAIAAALDPGCPHRVVTVGVGPAAAAAA